MKKTHLAVIIGILMLVVGFTAGPVQAAIYCDRIEVEIVEDYYTPYPSDFNPWGLAFGNTSDIILTYDPTTISSSGYIEFSSAFSPTNTFSAAISGTSGGGVFNETHDDGYYDGSPNGWLNLTGGVYDPASSDWDFLAYYAYFASPGLSRAELYIDTDGDSYLGLYNGGSYQELLLDVKLAGFDPADDRNMCTVPIPGTLMLLGSGLAGMMALQRRRRIK
jgi:hypothetical protein